ncbi:hypothetical protein BATDEDRAFT_34502 [Batrachochytrium dendrobatidis JAM81]|uniref:chitin synthase n=1 Tax=Batrachochytrium dendrobatidis (strain JAM81 / FGSC 10211) TaxID=684364 RepID=F4NWS5_BATDJ|nr:uncharacterized protein BATDEDRAFT_34502 [Batrachochytrium dendrobatidis JAM81]EGF82537.1 hypothetical protein BATDEDRAFT_34502 [Batrachochytrium dendrobatidis JAM81]|eukprot:XP_006676829.1 hypothetical protein BATDEDRAFT_34502 [Batrachochytrium dendrobatidis JAM81]
MDWATQSDDLAALLAQETTSAVANNSSPPAAETLIVHTLEQRCLLQRPYTYVGANVLLSVGAAAGSNNAVGGVGSLSAQYDRAAETAISTTDDDTLSPLPPHTMQLASTVFYQMLVHQENQSVVFCGMPSAGQSIDRRIFSQQLVDLSKNGKKKSRVLSGAVKMEYALDSFGMAKSPHAVDAACYGRYTEYQYSSTGRMVGVKLLDYTLDTARVTAGSSMDDGERTFNIFYQLLAGATKEEKETLHISEAASFAYLKGTKLARANTITRSGTLSRRFPTLGRSGTTSKKDGNTPVASPMAASSTSAHPSSSPEDAIPTAKDAKNFQELREHLKSLGIGRRTQSQIYQILAAILHLGNIVFGVDPNLKEDESTVVRSTETLNIAAALLGLSSKSLADSLTYRSKLVGRELCSIYLQPEGALLQRDALAETLYSLLFSWLVEHLNTRLCKSEEEVNSFVGLVDFPWFRSQYTGSATNFSIFIGNYTQERLIQYTQNCYYDDIDFIFKTDGLSVTLPSYRDNQWTVDVFRGTSRQKGLLALLDEEPESGEDFSLNRNQNLLTHLDNGLKSNPHYIASFQCSTVATASHSVATTSATVKNMFGIRHYNTESVVQYDLDSFLDQDICMSDFVALFRGSAGVAESDIPSKEPNVTFIAGLFSNRTGLKTIRSGRGAAIGAQKAQGPLRKPSLKRKKKPVTDVTTDSPAETKETGKDNASIAPKSKRVSPFTPAAESIDELMDTLKSTRHWSVISFSLSEPASSSYSASHIKWQLSQFNISELCQFRSVCDVDASHGLKYNVFTEKYASLLATKGLSHSAGSPRNLVKQFVAAQYWSTREVSLGNTMVFLSVSRWRWIHAAMKRLESTDENDNLLLNNNKTNSMMTLPSQPVPNAQPWLTSRQTGPLTEDDRSDVESNYESEYGYNDNDNRFPGKSTDMEMGNMNRTNMASPMSPVLGSKREIVDSVTPVTRLRKCWVCCTWTLTWWIPGPFLSCCGKMKRPDIRMAWREKVALCVIIFGLCMFLMFFIIGLRYIICPTVPIKSQSEVLQKAFRLGQQTVPWFAAHGRYYFAEDLMSQHIRDYGPGTGQGSLALYQFQQFYGNDVSNLFFKQDRWSVYCPGLAAPQQGWDYLDPSIPWMKRSDIQAATPMAMHRSTDPSGQPQPFSESLDRFAKGRIGWTEQAVNGMSSNTKRFIIIFDNVYYVSPIDALQNATFSLTVRNLLSPTPGSDVTAAWKATRAQSGELQQELDTALTCLNNIFYVGTVDRRDTFQCRLTGGLLLSTSIVLVCVVGFKFLAALQFSSRKEPEAGDKFVICMVPCYTEGTESLLKTLDSLATLNYDDKRKLLFVICDGMIIGSGNDRPTPRLVLDIFGVDPDIDPEPMAFQSLGEGNRQYNMGKIYSGLYEIRGRSVPFIVVAKVGSPTERVKPGNRGKRDSQLVLMRFLNRVHFNAEFAPMELDIYHHMKNIIGVSPSFYEFILMIDADTEVEPNALNRMVSVMVHDVKVMGLCGETRISNEKESWVTMVQVYEYFISHHLSKAFESLFGTVTCLPGCFSMYRIRSASKNVPLLVSPALLTEYSENSVDTLHMKNLLHLGEDRYLTTLMLKHFPTMRTKFAGEARCSTVVPDKWSVLLSQRRRWINSTVHNLFELVFLDQLCGLCCFSMRFVVFLDLFATFVQPAIVIYIVYLIYSVSTSTDTFPLLSIILIGCIYGFQVIIFLIKREWQHIAWMIIYLLAIPVFSFWIPCYSFWHFDDFSWGNTRVVVGEGKKTVYVADAEPFDIRSIPLKRWKDFEGSGGAGSVDSRGGVDAWEHGSQASGSIVQAGAHRNKAAGYAGSEYSSPGGGVYHRGSAASNYAGSAYGGPAPSISGSYHGGLPVIAQSTVPARYNTHDLTPGQAADPQRFSMISFGAYPTQTNEMQNARNSSASLVPGPFPSQQTNRYSMLSNTSQQVPVQTGPTDEQILADIRQILSSGDLMTLTKKQIRDDLGQRFGVDLRPRKETINRMIDEVLQGRL